MKAANSMAYLGSWPKPEKGKQNKSSEPDTPLTSFVLFPLPVSTGKCIFPPIFGFHGAVCSMSYAVKNNTNAVCSIVRAENQF